MALSTDDSLDVPNFFWGNSPNVNQQLRQRIALQMMARKDKGFPKNIGEGLTAIGDSIGDLGMARRLEQGDLAQQAAAQRDSASLLGGDQPAAYAPPDRAVTPPVAADTSAVLPQQPGPPLTADEAKAGVSSGDYNVLDAQSKLGFKPTPGYLQDAIAAKEPNPDMQAYYGALSAKEAPGGAKEISSTGASGPYQITRGTAKTLGITPQQRFDPAASTDAIRQFTAKNAAIFEKVNGRPPTFQELALMHQQGGQTGANMVAGTGNASPLNLARNNIPPGASAPQAVAGINRFYGMPNAPAPLGQRDAIASQLVQQPPPQGPPATPPGPPGGPLPNPTLAGATAPLPATLTPPPSPSPQGPGGPPPDQRLAMAGSALPPAPPALRTMPPPQQLAESGQPPPTPGYVMPEPQAPGTPPVVPLSPLGQRALAIINANPNNEYYQKGAIGQTLNNEIARQKQQQDAANEAYKKEYDSQIAMRMKRQEQLADQAKRIADYQKTQQEARTGALINPNEKNMVLGPDGIARPLQIEGRDPNAPPMGNVTEPQARQLVMHSWASDAAEKLQGKDQLLAHGLQQEMLGKVPLFGNQLQNAEYRRARAAANSFVLAFMRDTSGAAYGAKEMYDHASAFLPKQGDDAATLADKAQRRTDFVKTLYVGLGSAQPHADYLANQRKTEAATAQSAIDQEMSRFTPKGIGDSKYNPKTKATRVWNGTHWVE